MKKFSSIVFLLLGLVLGISGGFASTVSVKSDFKEVKLHRHYDVISFVSTASVFENFTLVNSFQTDHSYVMHETFIGTIILKEPTGSTDCKPIKDYGKYALTSSYIYNFKSNITRLSKDKYAGLVTCKLSSLSKADPSNLRQRQYFIRS